jgi:hypothetical protein
MAKKHQRTSGIANLGGSNGDIRNNQQLLGVSQSPYGPSAPTSAASMISIISNIETVLTTAQKVNRYETTGRLRSNNGLRRSITSSKYVIEFWVGAPRQLLFCFSSLLKSIGNGPKQTEIWTAQIALQHATAVG